MDIDLKYFDFLIQQELENYRNRCSDFYAYLYEQANQGFTKEQIVLFRDNYFYRTMQTAICVAKVVEAALKNADYLTAQSAVRNLVEELGSNKPNKTHPELLMYSHNEHFNKCFGVNRISLIESLSSPNILDETKNFTKIQLSLYESSNYIEVLAANYAQEEAATKMLDTFYNTLFVPFRNKYSKKEFKELTAYFTCHLDGLEERHADDAKNCLFNQCKSVSDVEIAINAISKILKAQSQIWIGIKNEFLNYKQILEYN
jgi:pyrroloquinoline quinone (PQQ) biosynthesis protein C